MRDARHAAEASGAHAAEVARGVVVARARDQHDVARAERTLGEPLRRAAVARHRPAAFGPGEQVAAIVGIREGEDDAEAGPALDQERDRDGAAAPAAQVVARAVVRVHEPERLARAAFDAARLLTQKARAGKLLEQPLADQVLRFGVGVGLVDRSARARRAGADRRAGTRLPRARPRWPRRARARDPGPWRGHSDLRRASVQTDARRAARDVRAGDGAAAAAPSGAGRAARAPRGSCAASRCPRPAARTRGRSRRRCSGRASACSRPAGSRRRTRSRGCRRRDRRRGSSRPRAGCGSPSVARAGRRSEALPRRPPSARTGGARRRSAERGSRRSALQGLAGPASDPLRFAITSRHRASSCCYLAPPGRGRQGFFGRDMSRTPATGARDEAREKTRWTSTNNPLEGESPMRSRFLIALLVCGVAGAPEAPPHRWNSQPAQHLGHRPSLRLRRSTIGSSRRSPSGSWAGRTSPLARSSRTCASNGSRPHRRDNSSTS